jgi:malonyl-CoA O-methyltransferase
MNKSTDLHQLDKKHVRRSFDAAAEHYDDVAVLQREIGQRIVDRLDLVKLVPQVILDVGSGTGIVCQALGDRYKKSRLISLDIASRMLLVARSKSTWLSHWLGKQTYVCADAEYLPLADNSVDLIFSNLTLQWCGELDQVFAEFRRVLRPDGLLMFSTFGPDTLKELRESWHKAEGSDAGFHVNDFIDMHDIGDALLRAGLADPVMDVERFTLTYPDVYKLMRELKGLGAHNSATDRRHSLTGKNRLMNMVANYETYRVNGTLPATYEIVYGHAWGSSEVKNIQISLESLSHHRVK